MSEECKKEVKRDELLSAQGEYLITPSHMWLFLVLATSYLNFAATSYEHKDQGPAASCCQTGLRKTHNMDRFRCKIVLQLEAQEQGDCCVSWGVNVRVGANEVCVAKCSDYRLNYEINKECYEDINKLCRNSCSHHMDKKLCGGTVLKCLTTNLEKIHSKSCQNAIFTFEKKESANVELDVPLQNACKVDLLKLCTKVSKDQSQTLSCLRSQHDKLSPQCQSEELRFSIMEVCFLLLYPDQKFVLLIIWWNSSQIWMWRQVQASGCWCIVKHFAPRTSSLSRSQTNFLVGSGF